MEPFDDDFDDDDFDDEVVYAVADAVHDHLDEPRRRSEIVDSLLGAGDLVAAVLDEVLASIGGDKDKLGRLVQDTLWDADTIWATSHDDPWLALSDELMEEAIFTHRLRAEEIANQELPLVPNLVALDYRADDALTVRDRGPLRVVRFARPATPGEDSSMLRGPDGWLDGFAPGDLVAFRRKGTTVDVDRAGDLVPDEEVVAALQEAANHRITPGRSEEGFPIVLDAMTTTPTAFRHPVRPLDELLRAAGMERRGFSWGHQGEEWTDAAQQARELRRMRAARAYGFSRCCLAAFDTVLSATCGDTDTTDNRVLRDLAHGSVVPAIAEEVLRFPEGPDQIDRLVELATAATGVSGPSGAAGHLVLALVARHRGEPLQAEEHLLQAQQADPEYDPAAQETVRYLLDRGALDQAVSLLRRAGSPFPAHVDELVIEVHERLVAPYNRAGRNEPCPCGSRRKYKVCCLREPRMRPRDRASLLGLKLAVFADDERETDVAFAAIASRGDPASRDLVVTDLVAVEGGAAREYLDKRGPLLPAEDVRLLEAALEERRRLWQVVGIDDRTSIRLHDPDSGRFARIDAPDLARTSDLVGTTFLWRIVRLGDVDYPLGPAVEVVPDEHESLRALLSEQATATQLAGWYGQRRVHSSRGSRVF